MDGYDLVMLEGPHLEGAKELVATVFPFQSPMERVSFPLLKRRGRISYRIIKAISGIDLLDFWVAVCDEGRVDGIIGLYSLRKDRREALWLGWYTVRSSVRGKGIGGALLRKAIYEARGRGAAYLRLYTTDSEMIGGGETAQSVYEHHGFQVKQASSHIGGITYSKEEGLKVHRVNKYIRELDLRLPGNR